MADPALHSPEIQTMLGVLQTRISAIFGAKLLGLYVVGSLVTGDFDFRSSDIDLIAVLEANPDDTEVVRLDAMHADIAGEYPQWNDRIEVIYIDAHRLNGDRADYTIAETSPGEPFHVKEIHHDEWLVNWHVLRGQSITLMGDDPKTFVEPIPQEKLVSIVTALARQTPEWIHADDQLGSQAYVMLTLCRALCFIRTGRFASKRQAAEWTAAHFPQWQPLIEKMLIWRAAGVNQMPGHVEAYPENRRFVEFMVGQIDSTPLDPTL